MIEVKLSPAPKGGRFLVIYNALIESRRTCLELERVTGIKRKVLKASLDNMVGSGYLVRNEDFWAVAPNSYREAAQSLRAIQNKGYRDSAKNEKVTPIREAQSALKFDAKPKAESAIGSSPISNSKQISITVSTPMYEKLCKDAEAVGKSKSEFIRLAIKYYAKNKNKQRPRLIAPEQTKRSWWKFWSKG